MGVCVGVGVCACVYVGGLNLTVRVYFAQRGAIGRGGDCGGAIGRGGDSGGAIGWGGDSGGACQAHFLHETEQNVNTRNKVTQEGNSMKRNKAERNERTRGARVPYYASHRASFAFFAAAV